MTRLLPLSCVIVLLLCPSVVLAQTKAVATPGSPQVQLPTGKAYPARPAGDLQPIVEPGPVTPGRAEQPALPPMPQQPDWAVRMTLEEQKWIDDVLHYWEARSTKIKVFECKFQKWD